jgi:hypothetical protein
MNKTKKARKKNVKDYFKDVFDTYFRGWRDGHAQALADVEHVLDDQTNTDQTSSWTTILGRGHWTCGWRCPHERHRPGGRADAARRRCG